MISIRWLKLLIKEASRKKHFTILAVAEGIISKEELEFSKKELKEIRKREHFPSAAYRIGAGIMERTGQEVRVTVPGHVQRGEVHVHTTEY